MNYQDYLQSLDPLSRIAHIYGSEPTHSALPENTGIFGQFADWVQEPTRPERGVAFGAAGDVARGWTQGRQAPYTDLVMAGMDIMPGLDDVATKGLLAAGTAIGPVWMGRQMMGAPVQKAVGGGGWGPSYSPEASRELLDSIDGLDPDTVAWLESNLVREQAATGRVSPVRMARAQQLAKEYRTKDPLKREAAELKINDEFGGIAGLGQILAGDKGLLGDVFKGQRGAIGGNLPMDEASRMRRARAMGFDTDQVFYRGTSADEMSLGKPGDKNPWSYATTSPDVASRYAKSKGLNIDTKSFEGSNVMPLFFNIKKKTKNPITGRKENAITLIDHGNGYVEAIIKDTSAARSKFAAFDPKKKNSADLLASYATLGLLGGGIGSGLLQSDQSY